MESLKATVTIKTILFKIHMSYWYKIITGSVKQTGDALQLL